MDRHDNDERTDEDDRPLRQIRDRPLHDEITDAEQNRLVQDVERQHRFIGSSQARRTKVQALARPAEECQNPQIRQQVGVFQSERSVWCGYNGVGNLDDRQNGRSSQPHPAQALDGAL